MFVLADVAQPLLGADFLSANSLLMDVRYNCLVNTQLFSSTPIKLAIQSAPNLNALCLEEHPFAKMLAQFPSITTPQFFGEPPKHSTQHYISTQVPFIHARPR